MGTQRCLSVWDAIEDTPAQARGHEAAFSADDDAKSHVARSGVSRSEAARLLGVTQLRISDLMRGRIEAFSLDKLVDMTAAARLNAGCKRE
jgi:predicted XRE-type DNA-binding protein